MTESEARTRIAEIDAKLESATRLRVVDAVMLASERAELAMKFGLQRTASRPLERRT